MAKKSSLKRYCLQCGKEFRIISMYAGLVSVIALSLQFLRIDYDILITCTYLLVYFLIANAEDIPIFNLSNSALSARFIIATSLHFLSRSISLYLKKNVLSGDLSDYRKDSSRPILIFIAIFVELLDVVRYLSAARVYLILAIIFIKYAVPLLVSAIHIACSNLSVVQFRFSSSQDEQSDKVTGIRRSSIRN